MHVSLRQEFEWSQFILFLGEIQFFGDQHRILQLLWFFAKVTLKRMPKITGIPCWTITPFCKRSMLAGLAFLKDFCLSVSLFPRNSLVERWLDGRIPLLPLVSRACTVRAEPELALSQCFRAGHDIGEIIASHRIAHIRTVCTLHGHTLVLRTERSHSTCSATMLLSCCVFLDSLLCVVELVSNPQPLHRSGHGCTVGFDLDPPV